MYGGDTRSLAAAAAEKAQQKHREDGPDGAQSHQAKAVRLRTAVASHMGNTDAQGQNERHRHGAGGDAARVKGDAQKFPIREGRQHKNHYVAPQQHPTQVDAVENAHHAHHHEKAHADAHRRQEHGLVDIGHGVRQNLQVGLRHRHCHAQGKGHQDDDGQLTDLRQGGTDLAADDGHGPLGAQGEQTQTHHDHQRTDEKGQQQCGLHRHQEQAQQRHNGYDGQHRNQRLPDLFREQGAGFVKI